MSKGKLYLVALALELVVVLLVMDILHYLLPAPWFVGTTMLLLTLMCPIAWTIEGWIYGEEEP